MRATVIGFRVVGAVITGLLAVAYGPALIVLVGLVVGCFVFAEWLDAARSGLYR